MVTSLLTVRSLRRVAATLCVVATACRPGGAPQGGPPDADSSSIRRDIAYLSSDKLEGRGTGTAGNDSAAAYIARRFAALGLTPGATPTSYLQPYVARSVARQRAGGVWELPSQNVVALLPGSDPALRNEYVIVGAHYDHLGRDTLGALDPDAKDVIRNGADDNASGTAAVLELARLLQRQPPKRSVVFVAFSGEELGLLGSAHYVAAPTVPLERVLAMVNFDMVGRLDKEQLQVFGVATATELPGIVDSANVAPALRLTATGDGFGSSDHASFYAKNMPVLHFFSGTHADYHRASDDVERINAGGEARIVNLAHRVVRTIADRSSRLTFTRAAERTTSRSTGGKGAYFGSIPDMAAGDGSGLRLSGVRGGSPADKAGVKADDIVVEFGGKAVKDLYDYTDAIGTYAPGDTISVVVVRNGQRVPLTVVLGKRGS